jgi:ketosteroid isomerase-like protein
MAPTNKPVSNRGTTVLTLRNGKITREESRQDVAMFMKQVSAGGPSAKR